MARARYTTHVIEDLIILVDHDKGKSITNDIDNVLKDLRSFGHRLDDCIIIYRDTMGRWDRIVTSGGNFYRFEPLNFKRGEKWFAPIRRRPIRRPLAEEGDHD